MAAFTAFALLPIIRFYPLKKAQKKCEVNYFLLKVYFE